MRIQIKQGSQRTGLQNHSQGSSARRRMKSPLLYCLPVNEGHRDLSAGAIDECCGKLNDNPGASIGQSGVGAIMPVVNQPEIPNEGAQVGGWSDEQIQVQPRANLPISPPANIRSLA